MIGPLSPRTRRCWWALACLGVAVGVCFRIGHLGRESLWFDEGYTAWIVSHSPGEIIRLILADTAPPLYYLLLHGWTEVFGRSEIALRSLSTVCSILTLLVAFGIARRMLRNPAAVAAAMWLMSLSFLQTWFAREARAYALMGLLGVAAFDWLQRHLAAGHRRWLIPLTLLIATEMYTHNMMAPYAMGLLLAWLVLPSEHSMRRRIAEIALVTGVAAVIYLPWAIGGLPAQLDMIQHAFWVDPLKRGNFLKAIVAMLGVQHYWSWAHLLDQVHLPIGDTTRPIFIVGCLLIASAFLSIVVQKGARRREAIGLLVAAMFPPAFVGLYSVLQTPLFTPK
ncbi:MAG: glycosyltransferase family 39 protein, partial [Tepidisphaeraceae bacterium]